MNEHDVEQSEAAIAATANLVVTCHNALLAGGIDPDLVAELVGDL
jgi:hypothetical protein